MACGLPIITTTNAQGIVVNNKNGFIIPIRDVNAIKEKIKFFYYNPEMIKKMGNESIKLINNKEKFSTSVFEIYKKIKEI